MEPAPIYGKPDKWYDEDMMKQQLGLSDGRISDFYCHFPRGDKWAVQEWKGANHVMDALEQMENTIRQLVEGQHRVHEGEIIMPKLSPSEAKIYAVNRQTHDLHHKGALSGVVVPYSSVPVKVFFHREIEEMKRRGFDWDSVSG
jgi:hypothetical protein